MAKCAGGCCSHQEDNKNDHGHDHDHDQNLTLQEILKESFFAIISFVILFAGIIIDFLKIPFFQDTLTQLIWYGVPFILVGFPVILTAIKLMLKGDFFNELSLMSIATIGAFVLGEFSEGLGVMVFYSIGEVFQGLAVSKAKNNIKALLDVRPDVAYVLRGDVIVPLDPEEVEIGEIIEIRTGEKIPLDGVLITEKAAFNTAALTGESVPRNIKANEEVLAGMLSSDKTVRIQVTKTYQNSTLARILTMVQEASENKSPTEQFIRKFARVYTPIVFGLATLLVIAPFFILGATEYEFATWFYRSLIFLVISCPCAFVISVPLGYFGGIGLGSSQGVLFKGGNFLEAMNNLKTLVTDKTGTITKGVFTVQEVIAEDKDLFFKNLLAIEKHSTHPIAKAIIEYLTTQNISPVEVDKVSEIAGLGLEGQVSQGTLLVGNIKLMDKNNISVPEHLRNIAKTVVFAGLNNSFLGAAVVADEIKEDARLAIQKLHKLGVNVIMLSGDKQEIVDEIAKELSIDEAYGELLPAQKAEYFEKIKKESKPKDIIAFVGDGINDAPVLALSDVGIAMGGLGSDLAIETADVIIQTDEPSKIPLAVNIAQETRKIVVQNITLAMGVKLIVLFLGAYGLASMWEAIFADVGVSLIATINSTRLLGKKFN